ncbi:MAG: DoxX family protein [Polyangiales bacterium]
MALAVHTTPAAQPVVRISPASALRIATVGARLLFGLMFLVIGIDGFLHFIPMPEEPMSDGAMAFGGALFQTGYMFPLIMGTQALCGALLVLNRKVPLALLILAPVVVNIFAFHYFLTPNELGMSIGIVLVHLYLAWSYRSAYRALLAS